MKKEEEKKTNKKSVSVQEETAYEVYQKKTKKNYIRFLIVISFLTILLIVLLISFVNKNSKVNTLTKENESYQTQIAVYNETYTVMYFAGGETIYTEKVKKFNNVQNVPAVPEKSGYTGTWSSDGKNITADMVIYAVYK